MQKKVLALSFVMAIIFAFITGYAFNNVYNVSFVDRQSNIFQTISETLKNHYFYDVTDEDVEAIYLNHIGKIVDAFSEFYDDPYTRLETSDAFVQSVNVGLGVSIFFDLNTPVISSVLFFSDAFTKLYPGDKILGIYINDDILLFETLTNTEDVVSYLRGALLDEKKFLIESPNGILRDVTITYQELNDASVSYAVLNEDVSYIKLSRFDAYQSQDNQGTAYQFSEALTYLEDNHLNASKTLIIDLRDNPGGSLSALHNKGNSQLPIGIIQQLIPYDENTSVFEFIDNNGVVTKYFGGLETFKSYEIIVLVNNRSASASEVLAASLSSYGYEIFGEQTFGKNVYQNSKIIAEINNTTYRLVYTEGQWTYKNQSIVDNPIVFTEASLKHLKTSMKISFTEDVSLDEVSAELRDVQRLLNIVFNTQLREDGYVDIQTKNALISFQTTLNLSVTGKYDYETFQAVYELYMKHTHDVFLDVDIKALIQLYENRYNNS